MTDHAALAARYLAAVDAQAPHASLTGEAADTTLSEAHLVQDAYHDLLRDRGGQLAGYKVALTSKAMQEFVGVDQPLAGAVFDNVVHKSPASVDLSGHRHLGVEFEVAVFVDRDLTAELGLHTRDSVREAVSECRPAFELIEDRNADYGSLDPFDLVAENAWNAGVVVAEAAGNWEAVDLESAATRLVLNGESAGEGKTGDALGHPLEALAWLANNLNERGYTLRAGQFVMTGSSIVTQFPSPGDELVFTIDGLGEARLSCR